MSACITPIFLHVTGRIKPGRGHSLSWPAFTVHSHSLHCVAAPSPLPSVSPGVQMSLSSPSTSANRSKEVTDLQGSFSPALSYRPQALRGASLEKHLVQQWVPSDSPAAGEPQGHSGHGLNRPLALPSITSPGNAVIALASALPSKLERVYWADEVKLTGCASWWWWAWPQCLCFLHKYRAWNMKNKNHFCKYFHSHVKPIGTITNIYVFLLKMRGICQMLPLLTVQSLSLYTDIIDKKNIFHSPVIHVYLWLALLRALHRALLDSQDCSDEFKAGIPYQ